MHYQIAEFSHVEGEPYYYVLLKVWLTEAGFLAGNPPILEEDFKMKLSPVGRRSILDMNGNPTGEIEEHAIDVRAQVIANIRAYLRRAAARKYRGNRTDPRIRRDQQDPNTVLSRQDIASLVGLRGDE